MEWECTIETFQNSVADLDEEASVHYYLDSSVKTFQNSVADLDEEASVHYYLGSSVLHIRC